MLRLARPWKDIPEKQPVEVYEPTRPKTIDALRDRTSAASKSVGVPRAAKKSAKPTVQAKTPVQNIARDIAYTDWVVPHLIKTPWELERHKRNSAWRRSKPMYRFPGHFFKSLPKDIYDCIIVQLEQIHLSHDQACPSCYLRDLHSLSLTSRAWDKTASAFMYRKVVVLANEEHAKLPKVKIRGTSRLNLLRRTLRENTGLARRVRELHLSDFQALYQNATIEREEVANLVASLVMACPRLERLVGFHIPYPHVFDRLSHALSTRPNLKERVWMLANIKRGSVEYDEDQVRGHYIAECDPTERFLDLNSGHPVLSTLVLDQEPEQSSTRLNFRAVIGTFRSFPHLRHLSISGLAATSFTNMALNSVPANLQSLRLENLIGVTEKGIQRFATSQLATSIEKLTLIDMGISSLLTISNILSPHLAKLKEFSLVQDKAPTLLGRDSTPDFCSPTLRFIHWELHSEASPLPAFPSSPSFPSTSLEPICCLATSLLAASIKDNAFPSLRRIRIPHDPQGVIQARCKPLATALLPSDTSKFATAPRITTSNGFSISLDERLPFAPKLRSSSLTTYTVTSTPRVDSVAGSPTFVPSIPPSSLIPIRSRLAAQSRILRARKNAAMTVRVYDPEGEVRLNKFIGGYVGQVGSKITYDLRADGRSVERSEWIMGIDDLVGEGESNGRERVRRCCGHLVSARGRVAVRVEELF